MLKQLSTLFCYRAMRYTTLARKKYERNPVMVASPLSISLQSSRLFSTKEEKNVFNNKPIKVKKGWDVWQVNIYFIVNLISFPF